MAIGARSRFALTSAALALAMAVAALLLPWYHIEQTALGVSSDNQFEVGDVRSVVTTSADSGSFERAAEYAYDDPPDFLEVGDLMQLESAVLLAALVLQVVFVMTCLAGARRAALFAGVASLALLTATWVLFVASIEGAVNSSAWVDRPGNAPISGFVGSTETTVLGIHVITSWGPMIGCVLLFLCSVAQLLALAAVWFSKNRRPCSSVSSTTLN